MTDATKPVDVTQMELVLRTFPNPGDINANGHIYGGWIMHQMDMAGAIFAMRKADGHCATVSADTIKFIAPIQKFDVVSLYARIERVGRTSLSVRLHCVSTRGRSAKEVDVANGLFTFVALDKDGKSREVPAQLRDEVSPAEPG